MNIGNQVVKNFRYQVPLPCEHSLPFHNMYNAQIAVSTDKPSIPA